MKIWRADANTIALSELFPLLRELLHRIPEAAEPAGDRAVENRLYSTPTAGREAEFDEEWKTLVGPDLRQLFESAMETVAEDLAGLPRDTYDEREILRIPVSHLEAWLNALNQARLALAARHRFTEDEMDSTPPDEHPHALPLFQIHFYGFLQERFMREMGD